MATTTVSSVCSKCSTIAKSGKSSCCGRGGSWFRNCGSAGNVKLDHTWYEGIQACKTWAQSKRSIERQSNAAQRLKWSGMTQTVALNTSIPIQDRKSSIAPTNASMINTTATSDDTSTAYDNTDKTPTTILSTSTNTVMINTLTTAEMSMIAAVHTSALTETTVTITTATIASTILITRTVKGTKIESIWIILGMCSNS